MYGVAGKFFGLPYGVWNTLPVGFEDRQQVRQVMRVRKVDMTCNECDDTAR